MATINVDKMVNEALGYQGIPYVYGGNGYPATCYKWNTSKGCSVHKKGVKYTGYDCSGFVTKVLKPYGIIMPRTTSAMQSWSPGKWGQTLGPSAAIKRGDVLLYSGHVTIAISSTHMVHAPNCGKKICTAEIYRRGMTKIFRFNDSGWGGSTNEGDQTTPSKPRDDYDILVDKSPVSLLQMETWAKTRKASDAFIQNARYTYEYSTRAKVNPAFVYANMAAISSFGYFKNLEIKEDYHNPGGLFDSSGKNIAKFDNWNDGIEALVDHFALCAGASGYPKQNSKDPQHFQSYYGKQKTLADLTRDWWKDDGRTANSMTAFITEMVNMPKDGNVPESIGKRVFIDPCRGGSDEGVKHGGLIEKDINLSMAHKIRAVLEGRGIAVKVSRGDGNNPSAEERIKNANDWVADCVISLRCNSSTSSSTSGFATYYSPSGDSVLAQNIQHQTTKFKNIYTKDLGTKELDNAVLKGSKSCAALVEMGYLTNSEDFNILQNRQNALAAGIARGIGQYLGVYWNEVPDKPDSKPSTPAQLWHSGKISSKCFRFIKGMEGYAPYRYQDSAGWWTICYGVTLHGEKDIYNRLVAQEPVPEEEGAKVSYDLKNERYGLKILDAVKKLGCTKQCQFDALVSLAYNAGPGSVTGSNSLTDAIRKDPNNENAIRAAWEKFKITAGGVVLRGLITRRKNECNMFFGKDVEIRPITQITKSGKYSGYVKENNGNGWLPKDEFIPDNGDPETDLSEYYPGWEQGDVGKYDPATKYIGQVYKVGDSTLNVRTGTSTSHDVLEKIREGDLVNVYFVYTNGWLKVKTQSGKIGYVSATYIKKYKDAPEKPYIPPTDAPTPKKLYTVYALRTNSKAEAEIVAEKIKELGYTNATVEARTQ